MSKSEPIEVDKTIVLPSYFPLSHKKCTKETEEFFACYSANGEMQHPQDADAGYRGLTICRDKMNAYTKCMSRYVKEVDQFARRGL